MALFERRKFERFDFQKEITVEALSPYGEKPIQYYARTINISQGGMLLYTIADFKEKTRCMVRFKGNNLRKMEKEGTILRLIKDERPDYLKESEKVYALEFRSAYNQEELQSILRPPSAK